MDARQRIVIVGAGGLGHPAALSLLRSWPGPGILELFILDGDRVERSNLNRQILFAPEDIGKEKGATLQRSLEARFPGKAVIECAGVELREDNVSALLRDATLVLDCTDHIPTKFLINDFCAASSIPFCYAGAVELTGICLAVPPRNGARGCLRCLFGNDAESRLVEETKTCQSAGIIGPVAGLVGAAQAQAALRLLSEGPAARPSELFRFSAERLEWNASPVMAASDCPLGCGNGKLTKIDLTGKRCPYTFLLTKLALEELPPEGLLEAVYESPDTRDNVRRSVEQEGHRVIASRRETADGFHLVVQRKIRAV